MNNVKNKKLTEWEEAVEMDRLLEQERNQQSKARLAKKSDDAYNGYLE